MGKWDPLRDYFMTRPARVKEVVLTIEQIRDIINAPLSPNAWVEGVFWQNIRTDNVNWRRSDAWTLAGWSAHEDVSNGRVRFTRDFKTAVKAMLGTPAPPDTVKGSRNETKRQTARKWKAAKKR
jgi:hypothetical protein